jgi:cytidylate kinase
MRKPIVAIDGPAGAGKSTVARAVAERLGLTYVDTGAMYRAVGLAAARRGLDPAAQPEAVADLAGQLNFEFRHAEGKTHLWVDGEDVSEAIRRPAISSLASVVAVNSGVRAALVSAQRELGAAGGVVMEGRDIGTVVFPQAEVKVYLDASPEERGRRRRRDLLAQGNDVPLEQVVRDIAERDLRDTTRADSPLRRAPGAHYLDTDGLTISQVVDRLVRLAEERPGS